LRADWLRTWAAAAGLALLLLAGWEILWRAQGFRPALNDDARLWALARHRVRPDSTVLVGTSRMHAGVRPSTFEEVTGAHTVQLAISAGMSYPVLENLARDPTFRGTAVCELSEIEITTGMTTDLEKGFVAAYERETLAARGEASLLRWVQEHLALGLSRLALPAVLAGVIRGQLPDSSAASSLFVGEDRTVSVDFSRRDLAQLRARVASWSVNQGPEVSPEEFVARACRFEVLAEQIERRGGRVVFVRMPVSGLLQEWLEKAYPKASYWDEFARRTHFQTVHFRDYPDLRVECPDYSHLDMRDAPRFTEALASITFQHSR
jgi:hypothetical protein